MIEKLKLLFKSKNEYQTQIEKCNEEINNITSSLPINRFNWLDYLREHGIVNFPLGEFTLHIYGVNTVISGIRYGAIPKYNKKGKLIDTEEKIYLITVDDEEVLYGSVAFFHQQLSRDPNGKDYLSLLIMLNDPDRERRAKVKRKALKRYKKAFVEEMDRLEEKYGLTFDVYEEPIPLQSWDDFDWERLKEYESDEE